MITLTLAQESLLDRIRVGCMASPEELLSGAYERICRVIQEVCIPDFMTLVADGYINFVLYNEEEWNIRILIQSYSREEALHAIYG